MSKPLADKTRFRLLAIGAALLLLGMIIAAGVVQSIDWSTYKAQYIIHASDGEPRRVRIAIPNGPAPKSGRPLLIAFPGTNDSADDMTAQSGLDELAAQHDWIVAYPEARIGTWDVMAAPGEHHADLAFHESLLDELIDRFPVDEDRISVTGMSNGAQFALYVAVFRPQRVNKAFVHSGCLSEYIEIPEADVSSPPICMIIGERDRQFFPTSVDRCAQTLVQKGYTVSMVRYPRLGHRWARREGVNSILIDFLTGGESRDTRHATLPSSAQPSRKH